MATVEEDEQVWKPVAATGERTREWRGHVDVDVEEALVADLPSPFERVRRGLADALEEERAVGTAFLLAPIAFAVGCIGYFSVPREPNVLAVLALGAVGVALCAVRGRRASPSLLLLGLLLLGFAAGKARTEWLATSVVERVRIAEIAGTVLWTERRADGSVRYTIGLEVGPDGVRIARVVHRKPNLVLTPGEGMSARLRLMPPPGPVVPGGYDFSFFGWFEGRGAVGTVLGEVRRENAGPATLGTTIARARFAIGERLSEGMHDRTAPLARALIIGDRSGIDPEVAEDLRLSGLAHILAISGLHMMLVTGLIFLGLRKTATLLSVGSLRLPVKKAAAIGAFFFATSYLALSGMNLSTQRAYVMVVIMLAAVLFDRRAATLRNVAIAALVVLAWQPEAIFAPGFQMSFAAATALVSSYGIILRWQQKRSRERRDGWWRSSLAWLAGLSFTSLVAGFATSPFAAYHFHRIALLSLLANLIAMPVVTFAVMPLAVIAVIAMPFGLDVLVLPILGWSLDAVTYVAAEVSSLGAVAKTGLVSPVTFLLWVTAFCLLTLLRTRLRLIGLLPAALALASPAAGGNAVAVIGENGRSVTVIEPTRLVHSSGRPGSFANGIVAESFPRPRNPGRFRCDPLGCVHQSGGLTYAVSKDRAGLRDDCSRADLIVTRYTAQCANEHGAKIIDRPVLQRRGSAVVTRDAQGELSLNHAYGTFPRPWTRHRFAE